MIHFSRNLELEAELENERASAAHAFREQQNAELEKLRTNLELSQQKEQQVNEELEKLNACYATVSFMNLILQRKDEINGFSLVNFSFQFQLF